MNLLKTISSWAAFYSVMLMLALFLYSCARLRFAMAEYWRAKANTERKKVNLAAK